jgi:hypothetical protein
MLVAEVLGHAGETKKSAVANYRLILCVESDIVLTESAALFYGRDLLAAPGNAHHVFHKILHNKAANPITPRISK